MEAVLTRIDADSAALTAEELCSRYAPKVSRFAAMVSRGSQEADDLAQVVAAAIGADEIDGGGDTSEASVRCAFTSGPG
jgi:DNA-directed RNA polymerase specialized sigma24 family protein